MFFYAVNNFSIFYNMIYVRISLVLLHIKENMKLFNETIRVHDETGEVSILDVIQSIVPSSSQEYALKMMYDVLGKNKYLVEFKSINGVGEPTHVCEIYILFVIIWMLPCFTKTQLRRRINSLLGKPYSISLKNELDMVWESFGQLRTFEEFMSEPE